MKKDRNQKRFKRLNTSLFASVFFMFLFVVFYVISSLKALFAPEIEKILFFGTGVFGWLCFFALTISTVGFAVWVYRATANKIRMGYIKIDHREAVTPAFAVYSLFIPIVHLYKPYIVLKEIWVAANNTYYDDEQYPRLFLKAWWFFYIVIVLKFYLKIFLFNMSSMETLSFLVADMSLAIVYFFLFSYALVRISLKQKNAIAKLQRT